jgi:hypothetical protein
MCAARRGAVQGQEAVQPVLRADAARVKCTARPFGHITIMRISGRNLERAAIELNFRVTREPPQSLNTMERPVVIPLAALQWATRGAFEPASAVLSQVEAHTGLCY